MTREALDERIRPAAQFDSYPGESAHTYSEAGYRAMPWQQTYERRQRLYERDMMQVVDLLEGAFNGKDLARFYLKRAMGGGFREALSTSDFPNLFGDVIDRAVLANYTETPYTWNLIAKQSEVNDFRPVKRFRVDGGTGLLASTSAGIANVDSAGALVPIGQGAQYPEDSLVDAEYTYRLFKIGKRMPFFW